MVGSTKAAGRLAVVAAAVAVGIGVAGCSNSGATSASAPVASTSAAASSGTTPASASAPASTPASTSSSASATATASSRAASSTPSAAASTSPASAGPAPCPTSGLTVKAGLSQGTAGSIYQVIEFTNVSGSPCTLYGFPGVALTSGTAPSTQVGLAASRSNATAATVITLAAGQTASALLRIVDALNFPSADCSPTATSYLQIYPPNQTAAIYLAYKSTGCTSTKVNLLSVSVVTTGTGG
jgi:hypothetical protein